MLRLFEQICRPADINLLIAADEDHATLAGGGAYATPWHWHDCLMFILPSQGAVEFRHEDKHGGTWLSPDRFAVVPAHRAHRTQAALGAHQHVALYVTEAALHQFDDSLGSLKEFYRRTRAPVFVRKSSTLRTLQELSIRSDIGSYGSSKIRHGLSSALLMQCIADVVTGEPLSTASHREHGAAVVADLKAFIVLHADQSIPLDALGERFGISRRHITRLFRAMTGVSIGEFQQQVRIQKACKLLRETDLPVGEIAFRVGFESGAALSRTMRRAHGAAPSAVRSGMARSVKI